MEEVDESYINDLYLREFDKLHRRLDAIENKLTDICVVNDRIKKEAAFKRTYSQTHLYGAKHFAMSDYNSGDSDNDSNEIIEDEEMEPVIKRRCVCCIIS